MKFSFTSALALASTFTGVFAAPSAPSTEIEQREPLLDIASAHKKSFSAADALTIVKSLNSELHQFAVSINKTTSKVGKHSSAADKKAAVKHVGSQMTAMTMAINKAVGEIGVKANKGHFSTDAKKPKGNNPVQALADALKTTLITAAGTVNTALAVLGLTPLLAFLTPLTGSLSGLVLTLVAVVDSLLPILNTILDGVVIGLSGLLAGLIL